MSPPRILRTILLCWLVSCAVIGAPRRLETAVAPDPAPVPVVPVVAPEVPPPPPEPQPVLVDVSVPREFRGLWVATVSNLDFPTRKGLSAEALANELSRLVEVSTQRGINALVFQVRPEGDALYASTLEPWSRFLTGRQGGDPGIDPLAVLVEEAHDAGIEVHAWFNPYRSSSNRGAQVADNHVSRTCRDHVCPWGGVEWLDPGAPVVQQHTLAVIGDVLDRYDIDGVHLDDYFYPYPSAGRTFPDGDTYQAYRDAGGDLSRNAWRRHNVDTMVSAISTLVSTERPDCRMGISPFGIYRPGIPPGIRGLDQVDALHADPLLWYREGWMDYLAPQLYWSTKKQGQRYDVLLDWWNDQVSLDKPLLVGLNATKIGSDSDWSAAEFRTQVTLSRRAAQTAGQIWFRAAPLMRNQSGLGDLLSELYADPALPPATPSLVGQPVAPPVVTDAPDHLAIDHPSREDVRTFVVYVEDGAGWRMDRLLPRSTEQLPASVRGAAISAVLRGGIESPGVVVGR